MDQSTVRITKFLSKIASCALHKRLQESMLGGCGASITALREQNDQYLCTFATKLIDKELTFRPICVRVQSIENLKNNIFEGLCTIEVKICEIGNDILCTFEESDFKKVQKFKRIAIVGDATGALEITLWESQFNKIELGNCYQIKLVKSRLINFELSFSANADTSYEFSIVD
ncbi:unnamed protein product [Rotaria sp. Silwood2]|nr:unnamed protein product [Rotaria sp. Silwood2]CAF4439028.1 unnamed protein product [Rotaria sp. Silwood2]